MGGEQELRPLCGPCRAERDRWLDTIPNRLIPRPGFAHGSGAAYDVTPAGAAGNRSARYQEWADTVRFQRELIATACWNGQHVSEQEVPAMTHPLMSDPPGPWPGSPPGPPPPSPLPPDV